ncbi:MAG: hypothetical protein ACE15C_13805 [Phycisphaerae bacterium]
MRPNIARSIAAAVFLALACGGMLGCQAQSAKCGTLYFENATQATDARVDETGFYAKFKLDISGCRGSKVPVQFWAQNSSGGEVFLGEAIAQPPYENTTWSEFRVFLPLSRMGPLTTMRKCSIYVRSPIDPSEFIGKAEYDLKEPYQVPKFVWTWRQWQDDAAVDSGKGFHVAARLDVKGNKDRSIDVVIRLEDVDGNILRTASGDPLVFERGKITPGFENCYYDKLSLDVPYESLSHLRPGMMVCARPSLRIDGKVEPGNVILKFWAGGSLETIYKRFKTDAEQFDEEITQLDRRLKALEGGGK